MKVFFFACVRVVCSWVLLLESQAVAAGILGSKGARSEHFAGPMKSASSGTIASHRAKYALQTLFCALLCKAFFMQ
jgi:hypothetical protein